MQKARRLLIGAAAVTLSLVASCRATEDPSGDPEGALTLRVTDTGKRFVILLSNNTSDPVTINKLLRPNGFDPELSFIIDGEPAKFARHPGMGHVSPQDVSEPSLVLVPDHIYGTSLRDIDMASLFGIEEGQCRMIKVIYKNKLDFPEIDDIELISNTVKYCH